MLAVNRQWNFLFCEWFSKVVYWYFRSFYLCFFHSENHLLTIQVKAQIRKSTFHIKVELPTLAGNKHFSIPILPHWMHLSHPSTKMDGRNPSKMEIKRPIPAPAYFWQLQTSFSKFHFRENKNTSESFI